MPDPGQAVNDADHSPIADALLRQFRCAISDGDRSRAAWILQEGMAACLEHWDHESVLLGQTGWSVPIIQCHHDDHNRLEGLMVQALIDLHAGRTVTPDMLASFLEEVCCHVASFDLPLAEAIRQRQPDHGAGPS